MVVSNGEAAVIDAIRTVEAYEQFAKENDVTITNVMDTHLHADHISGGRKLAEKVGVRIGYRQKMRRKLFSHMNRSLKDLLLRWGY